MNVKTKSHKFSIYDDDLCTRIVAQDTNLCREKKTTDGGPRNTHTQHYRDFPSAFNRADRRLSANDSDHPRVTRPARGTKTCSTHTANYHWDHTDRQADL